MQNRRVLLLAPSAYPLGGVAVWLAYLLPGLAAHGWQARAGLVAGRWHDVAAYRAAYPGLDAIAIDNPTGSAEGRIRALAEALRRERPEVVLAVNIVDTYAAVQRVRREGLPIKVAMALHGIGVDLLSDLARGAARAGCGDRHQPSGLRALYAGGRQARRAGVLRRLRLPKVWSTLKTWTARRSMADPLAMSILFPLAT